MMESSHYPDGKIPAIITGKVSVPMMKDLLLDSVEFKSSYRFSFNHEQFMFHWDDYGAHLDLNLFQSNDNENNLESMGSWKNKRKGSKSGVSKTLLPDLAPSMLDYITSKVPHMDMINSNTRCVSHCLDLPLRCELVYLDYEGRSDGEAMKRIMIGLRPQEVILVGNDQQAVEHLATYCRGVMLLDSKFVHTPKSLEVVNCTKEGDIYQARMKDSLVSSLKFTKIRDYELAWVEATLYLENSPNQLNTSQSADVDMNGLNINLTPLIANQLPVLNLPTGDVPSHKTVFVNEPKLSDLKQIFISQGLLAEFMSGVLVIDNCVAIKRTEAGKLMLEGVLSSTYFNVRRILYQQFAIFLYKAVEDAQGLLNRLRSHEKTVDLLQQQSSLVKSQLLAMKQYQEEILIYDEFTSRVSSNGSKSQLILCLAAENKELEQLRMENKTLRNSLEEHEAALDIIMVKYRGQVANLMRTNKEEKLIKSMLQSGELNSILTKSSAISGPKSNLDVSGRSTQSANPPNSVISNQIDDLVSIIRSISNQGDAYATELEEEIQRLRSENLGLRELLHISTSYSSEVANSDVGGQFSCTALDKSDDCDQMRQGRPMFESAKFDESGKFVNLYLPRGLPSSSAYLQHDYDGDDDDDDGDTTTTNNNNNNNNNKSNNSNKYMDFLSHKSEENGTIVPKPSLCNKGTFPFGKVGVAIADGDDDDEDDDGDGCGDGGSGDADDDDIIVRKVVSDDDDDTCNNLSALDYS